MVNLLINRKIVTNCKYFLSGYDIQFPSRDKSTAKENIHSPKLRCLAEILLAVQMVYEMKITISTVDSNTMKHGNVLNNLPAMIAYVVTSGLTKHKKRTFDQYSQQTDEFLKYTTSLIRSFTAKIIVL